MALKERLKKKYIITRFEISLLVIFGMFLILFLYQIWPRFRSDAMSFSWYIYLIILVLIKILLVPFYKRTNSKK